MARCVDSVTGAEGSAARHRGVAAQQRDLDWRWTPDGGAGALATLAASARTPAHPAHSPARRTAQRAQQEHPPSRCPASTLTMAAAPHVGAALTGAQRRPRGQGSRSRHCRVSARTPGWTRSGSIVRRSSGVRPTRSECLSDPRWVEPFQDRRRSRCSDWGRLAFYVRTPDDPLRLRGRCHAPTCRPIPASTPPAVAGWLGLPPWSPRPAAVRGPDRRAGASRGTRRRRSAAADPHGRAAPQHGGPEGRGDAPVPRELHRLRRAVGLRAGLVRGARRQAPAAEPERRRRRPRRRLRARQHPRDPRRHDERVPRLQPDLAAAARSAGRTCRRGQGRPVAGHGSQVQAGDRALHQGQDERRGQGAGRRRRRRPLA